MNALYLASYSARDFGDQGRNGFFGCSGGVFSPH